ncbi:MAG: Ig-like domain-containing protein, partial [Verrucomicrobiales bacterium]
MKRWHSFIGAALVLLGIQFQAIAASQPYAEAGIIKSPDNWVISVYFSGMVDRSTLSSDDHYQINEGSLGFIDIDKLNGAVVIPVTGLNPNFTYQLTIKNLKDTNGNALPTLPLQLQTKLFSWVTMGANELALQS